MKQLTTAVLLLLITLTAFAQEEQPMEQGAQDAGMQAWMEFMTPGDQHAMMAKGAGEWNVKNTYWFMPGAEPQVSEGTASAEMILGGRYLLTNHHGTVMGMPFEGMSIEAYDNAAEKFVSIWIDNMGTGLAVAEGNFDAETGLLVYEGSMTDPMTKEDAWFKETFNHVDENTMVMEMFMKAPDGSEFKNMEITFTRK